MMKASAALPLFGRGQDRAGQVITFLGEPFLAGAANNRVEQVISC